MPAYAQKRRQRRFLVLFYKRDWQGCDNRRHSKDHLTPVTEPSSSPATASPAALIAPSLPRRMACWTYEGMLMFGVVFIAGYLFSTLTQTHNALENRFALQAFLFWVFGIYFTWFWHKGQSLAMKTWHIKVVDRHGQPLTQARALWRYVLSWIWFVPPLAAGWIWSLSGGEIAVLVIGWVSVWAILARFHPQRQFWHDAWAQTRLVSSEAK
jgi:uncharacterized RDD family membrane protein YckC